MAVVVALLGVPHTGHAAGASNEAGPREALHILLEVDTEAAVSEWLEKMRDSVRSILRGERISYEDLQVADDHVQVTIQNPDEVQTAKHLLNATAKTVEFNSFHKAHLILRADERHIAAVRDAAVRAGMARIRFRAICLVKETSGDPRDLVVRRVEKGDRIEVVFSTGLESKFMSGRCTHEPSHSRITLHAVKGKPDGFPAQ